MSNSLYIGNVHFLFENDLKFSADLNEFLFPITPPTRKVNCKIHFAAQPKPINFHPVAQIEYPPQIIGTIPSGECRIYYDIFTKYPIAMYQEISINSILVTFYNQTSDNFEFNLNTLNYFAIERHMALAKALILHSSFITINNKALLFTAPSGTGKSTQANLWKKHKNAKIINGDRALLLPTPSGWKVAGFPFSGSSNIYHNGLFPIKAIIIIHQSYENKGEYTTTIQAFKNIYPEIVRNYWNSDYDMTICQQLENLLEKIPAIVYGCNMKEEAVDYLESILQNQKY